jgi:hypothetical protein
MKAPRWAVSVAAGAATIPIGLGFGLPPLLALLGGSGVTWLGARRGAGHAWLMTASLAASLAL